MKRIVPVVLFAFLPLLSGCLTSRTLDAVNTRTSKTLGDVVDHVEKAAITKDGQLYIFFEGNMTNSAQRGRFILTFPLAQIHVHTENYPASSTNKIICGSINVPRSAIKTNANAQESLGAIFKAVPVGSPITYPDGSNLWDFVEAYKLLPNTTQTLYPIKDLRSTNHYDWPAPMEFVYVDASAKQAFTFIYVDRVTVWSAKNKGYYLLLPLTIPLDIATIPIQIPFILLMMGSINC